MNHARIIGTIGLVPALVCASCATLHGAWYYQTADAVAAEAASGDAKDGSRAAATITAAGGIAGNRGAEPCDVAGLYFAIVNDHHAPFDVTRVQINGERAEGAGWVCEGGSRRVGRGQLLVLKLPTTAQASCAVPLEARLWKSGSSMPTRIQVSGAMPSALPGVWLQCPAAFITACANRSNAVEALACRPVGE